ncbi:MAG: hypothetical protein ACOX3W_04220 [Christensenellaceae bacterium]|jgi:hypothetical protein
MKRNKKILLCICCLYILALLLTACAQIETEAPLRVFFVGNSLMYTGDVPEQFDALCKENGLNVEVKQALFPNSTIKDHIDALKENPELSLVCEWADIVVMNEYGAGMQFGNIVVESKPYIEQMQALFQEGTQFYYLFNPLDVGLERIAEIGEELVTYIPSAVTHEIMIEKGFAYAELHGTTDFHPNELLGYATALTVYCELFQIDAEAVKAAPSQIAWEQMPGENETEKEEMHEILKASVTESFLRDLKEYDTIKGLEFEGYENMDHGTVFIYKQAIPTSIPFENGNVARFIEYARKEFLTTLAEENLEIDAELAPAYLFLVEKESYNLGFLTVAKDNETGINTYYRGTFKFSFHGEQVIYYYIICREEISAEEIPVISLLHGDGSDLDAYTTEDYMMEEDEWKNHVREIKSGGAQAVLYHFDAGEHDVKQVKIHSSDKVGNEKEMVVEAPAENFYIIVEGDIYYSNQTIVFVLADGSEKKGRIMGGVGDGEDSIHEYTSGGEWRQPVDEVEILM